VSAQEEASLHSPDVLETPFGTMEFFECPANTLSFVDDLWQRYVADMGNAGSDRGQGGKYLFLPPGYDGEVPDGYFVFSSPTYSNWVVIRDLDGLDALLTTRIYPLAAADDPPQTGFVYFAEASFNGIHANDFSFFEEVDEIIQEEPEGSLDPERAGHWRPSASCAAAPSHPTPAGATSSIERRGWGPGSSARCCTSRVTPTCTSPRTPRGRRPSTRTAGRQRRQLAADRSRQELVPDPAALRPARGLVRPDVATGRAPPDRASPRPARGVGPGQVRSSRRSRRRSG
jgi:hypothetical protein